MSMDSHFQTVIKEATDYPYVSEIDRCMACDIVNVFDGDISTSGDSTNKVPRKISVVASVYDIENWNRSRDKLIELLNWVSGDFFSFSFEQNEELFDTFLLPTVSAGKKAFKMVSASFSASGFLFFLAIIRSPLSFILEK